MADDLSKHWFVVQGMETMSTSRGDRRDGPMAMKVPGVHSGNVSGSSPLPDSGLPEMLPEWTARHGEWVVESVSPLINLPIFNVLVSF